MTLNITIPQLNSNSKSTKDKVISILSNKWPLSAKEIFNILQREHGAEVSYQAVHKILNELQEEKILEKNGKTYQISKEWIQRVKKFGSELEEKYVNGKKVDFEHFESMHLVFDNFMNLARFIVNDFFINFPNPKNKSFVCFWRHTYGIIGASETEYANMKKMFTENVHYGICRNNTKLDNYLAEFYEKMGKKCINGVDYPFYDDTYICGDFVCQAFFPKEYLKKIDNFFKQIKEMTPEVLQKYAEVQFSPQIKGHLVIFKNHEFAEILRDYAIKVYEGRKK